MMKPETLIRRALKKPPHSTIAERMAAIAQVAKQYGHKPAYVRKIVLMGDKRKFFDAKSTVELMLDIQNFRFHDLRHTFASQLIMAGVDMSTIQACLGHSTQAMTQRYAHLAPDHIKKQVRMLDKIFSSASVRVKLPEEQPAQKPAHTPQNSLQVIESANDPICYIRRICEQP
jgi:integrase